MSNKIQYKLRTLSFSQETYINTGEVLHKLYVELLADAVIYELKKQGIISYE